MHGVILNVSDIFMGRPVVDAFVNAIADVSWRKVVAKVIIWALINLLVVAVVGSVSPTTSVSAPTTSIMTGPMVTGGAIIIVVIPFSNIVWR